MALGIMMMMMICQHNVLGHLPAAAPQGWRLMTSCWSSDVPENIFISKIEARHGGMFTDLFSQFSPQAPPFIVRFSDWHAPGGSRWRWSTSSSGKQPGLDSSRFRRDWAPLKPCLLFTFASMRDIPMLVSWSSSPQRKYMHVIFLLLAKEHFVSIYCVWGEIEFQEVQYFRLG